MCVLVCMLVVKKRIKLILNEWSQVRVAHKVVSKSRISLVAGVVYSELSVLCLWFVDELWQTLELQIPR